jgi:hypothetical protein
MEDIPVVVVAYNRPLSLRRLLGSLLKAEFSGRVPLYISIDHGGGQETIDTARRFNWPFGSVEVRVQQEHLGLKKHIMQCAALAESHRAVIILEDDLYVSPGFYRYTLKAVDYYADDPRIAGISLYSHGYNETAQFPFQPLVDESDVFFMQYASSWGQCWTGEQWKGFMEWLKANEAVLDQKFAKLPQNVHNWPSSSWKKIFIAYMIDAGTFFVYPHHSLTTNFADAGQHMIRHEHFLQRPLLSVSKPFIFKSFDDSPAVYDSYCEILPDRLKRLCPDLNEYDFDTDLYGMKDPAAGSSPLLLTSERCSNALLSWGRELKPAEANIIGQIDGHHFSLSKREDVSRKSFFRKLMKCSRKDETAYHLGVRFYHTLKGKFLLAGGLILYHPRIYPLLRRILGKGK